MPAAERRPLVTVIPEHIARLVDSFVVGVELADKIECEIRSLGYAKQWEMRPAAAAAVMADLRPRLARVPGLIVEPEHGLVVSPVLTDPFDVAARASVVGRIATALASDDWRLDSFALVSWAEVPVAMNLRPRYPVPAGQIIDWARAAALDPVRALTLDPWLSGRAPVRDPDTFVAFHTELGPDERALVRKIVLARNPFRIASALSNPDSDRIRSMSGPLARAGWLTVSEGDPANLAPFALVAGSRAKRLARYELLVQADGC